MRAVGVGQVAMDNYTSDPGGYGWELVEDPSVSVRCGSFPAAFLSNTLASGQDNPSASSSFGAFTFGIPQAESISSTASSPIKQGFLVSVVAKDDDRSVTTGQQPDSDWIEPQLVFSEAQSCQFHCFDIFDAYKLLQNIPEAKEAIVSILSDPAVWDAVTKNKRLQELICHMHQYKGFPNDGYRSEMMKSDAHLSPNTDTYTFCSPSVLYTRGRQAFNILRKKFAAVTDTLLPSRETQLVKSNEDLLDRTRRSSVILVAVVLMLIISKRPHI